MTMVTLASTRIYDMREHLPSRPRFRRVERVRLVNMPWARPGSGFTLLFEAFVMTLIMAMPVVAAARLVGEQDRRLWRVVPYYVAKAVARMDLADLRRVAIDETAAKRGHAYISLFVDIDARAVIRRAISRTSAP